MSSIAGFDYDIFISYAHIDNQPLDKGLQGWVETLHERLSVRLAQLLGKEARIWRDPKLQGNDVFANTLVDRVTKAAILVSILSPRYIQSEWCMKELGEFSKCAQTGRGLSVDDKLRIFKVVKTYIPFDEHPPLLKGVIGYEFFEYDAARDRAREFSPEIVPARDIRYWEKLDDLAYDIKRLIETIRDHRTGEDSPTAAPAATVYLAETSSDLTEQRDSVRRELVERGYEVLPSNSLPLVGQAFCQNAEDCLGRSKLAIHLIGERYGIIPEGESRSIIELQADLSAARGPELQRIIWMPAGLEARDDRQREFISRLRSMHDTHRGTDLVETRLEELKTVIQEKLNHLNKPDPAPADPGDAEAANVYLICDRQDMDSVRPVEDYLFDSGFDVTLPALEGDESQMIQDHKDNLMMCDAVMIYYGQANEIWMRMKQRELQKIAGYGRSAPLAAKAIYISGPPTASKERVRDHDALVIKNYDGFSPERLQPFLERVQRSKGA